MELAGEGPREGMESWSYWPTEEQRENDIIRREHDVSLTIMTMVALTVGRVVAEMKRREWEKIADGEIQ